MKINIYLKSGQTIRLDHVSNVTVTHSTATGELIGYEITRLDNFPPKAEKLLTLEVDQIAAITTEDRKD